MFENCSHCILLGSLYFITVTIFYYGYRLQMRFHVFSGSKGITRFERGGSVIYL
ncbi:Uncharacterized protein YP598_2481 [Yersinia pseudotuberculosis]|nr:Uncharacterized protein YP598_2481 [Yersinia pseudotuberculosis]